MLGQFKEYINYIDPNTGVLTETKFLSDKFGYSEVQPFYLTEADTYGGSLYDREDDPKIVHGRTTGSLISIHIIHKDDSHFRIF